MLEMYSGYHMTDSGFIHVFLLLIGFFLLLFMNFPLTLLPSFPYLCTIRSQTIRVGAHVLALEEIINMV